MDGSHIVQPELEISLLGEPRVFSNGVLVPLPTSRKTRALLAYLVRTRRTHRRDRLCTMFWNIPDDPKASLRWSLSKLRRVLNTPDHMRISADRERVRYDGRGSVLDIDAIQTALRVSGPSLQVEDLEQMARRLDGVFLDGLDGAGDEGFECWLEAERDDARAMRVTVLRQLVSHPDISQATAEKWLRFWRGIDPDGADAHMETVAADAQGLRDRVPGLDLLMARRSTSVTVVEPVTDAAAKPAPAPAREHHPRRQQQRIGFCAARDGTKIAYATVGSGAPILRAGNWFNHLELDRESPIWGRAFSKLAQRRTLVRYDERGCGLSDWDVAKLSLETFVEDLTTVADKLGLERFPLIGLSHGCAVAIEYAVRNPERVSGLVLIGGFAAGWHHAACSEERARREAVRRLTEVGWASDNPAYRHIFSLTFMPDANTDVLTWFDEYQLQATSARNAARFQDAFGNIDVRQKLAAVTAPTVVLHSKYDQRVPIAQGLELAREIPNAHFVPLESRNHILVEDEPAWDVCSSAINAFLSEHGI
ncbi:alpha/beta hydrolase [Jiella endophytica]|uniref:Alpha/beta hydrolase n=1 Tax=Jiella endophytica TaxID=2558362 RepID=A0A4Y8RN54_9HYPH|nr:alpha/beta hydrolase [Jiella endophytica]